MPKESRRRDPREIITAYECGRIWRAAVSTGTPPLPKHSAASALLSSGEHRILAEVRVRDDPHDAFDSWMISAKAWNRSRAGSILIGKWSDTTLWIQWFDGLRPLTMERDGRGFEVIRIPLHRLHDPRDASPFDGVDEPPARTRFRPVRLSEPPRQCERCPDRPQPALPLGEDPREPWPRCVLCLPPSLFAPPPLDT